MDRKTNYSNAERFWLSLAGAVSLLGLNVAFLYGVFAAPGALQAALKNPIALAFMLEAFLLVALLAYLLKKWEVTRLSWPMFVLLSLAGGIAFALPVVLLWRSRLSADQP